MLSGIFLVRFISNNHNFGEGLVVINRGLVNGGDHAYLYQGRLDSYGDDLRALITVKHYNGPLNSVIGPLKEFTLNLSGKKSGERFEISGGITNRPDLKISITGHKVAEVFE